MVLDLIYTFIKRSYVLRIKVLNRHKIIFITSSLSFRKIQNVVSDLHVPETLNGDVPVRFVTCVMHSGWRAEEHARAPVEML